MHVVNKSAECAVFTATGDSQHIFCQPPGGGDIIGTAGYQQFAQASFQNQFQLTGHHIAIINIQLSEQLCGKCKGTLFLLAG